MSDSEADFVFKVTVIGDGQVGKSSLIRRYTQASFQTQYTKTIGAQFSSYSDEVVNLKCHLSLWDIAGQDDHFFLRPVFYKGTSCGIIVFSLEDSNHGKESIKRISAWHGDIKKFCGDIPIVILGNKLDLVADESSKDAEVQKIVDKRGFLGFYKTSAKTGKGVITAFNTLIDALYTRFKKMSEDLQ